MACLLAPVLGARPAAAAPAGTKGAPRLLLILVVDQLRADYLERFSPLFMEPRKGGTIGGFRYLMERGAHHLDAHHSHYPTETGPGHAALSTGTWPRLHGIVSNSWYDRAKAGSRNCVEDERYAVIGGSEEGRPVSPGNLLVTTLGDQLKMGTGGRAKVWGIGFKDRSAVLTSGHLADGALWIEWSTMKWISSTYYFPEGKLPGWVENLNNEKRADRFFGRSWELSVPPEALEGVWAAGEIEKRDVGGLGKDFPHTLGAGEESPGPAFYRVFPVTPFGNEFVVDAAIELMERESIGKDPVTDLFAVTFATNDVAGHTWGPDSREVLDITVRTDRQISRLLNHVDAAVEGGLSNVTILLSADHGVAPVLAAAKEAGLPAGFIGVTELRDEIESALDRRFGEAAWIGGFSSAGIYLNRDAISARRLDQSDLEDVAAAAALGHPGILAAYTRTQLVTGRMPRDGAADRIQESFHPGRSGDLILLARPYWQGSRTSEGSRAGASHGSVHDYDTRVPLIFAGWGIRPGVHGERVSTMDAAPTLAALLGILPPNASQGRVLSHVIGLD